MRSRRSLNIFSNSSDFMKTRPKRTRIIMLQSFLRDELFTDYGCSYTITVLKQGRAEKK